MKKYLNSPAGSSVPDRAEAFRLNQALARKMAAGSWSLQEVLMAIAEDDLAGAVWLLDTGGPSRSAPPAGRSLDESHRKFAANPLQIQHAQLQRAVHGNTNFRF